MHKRLLVAMFVAFAAIGCNETNEKEAATANTEARPAAPVESKLDEKGTEQLMNVVTNYYELKDALVATDAAKTDVAANNLNVSVDSMNAYLKNDSANGATFVSLLDTISMSSKKIIAENDNTTEKKRVHFEKVSDMMFALLQKAALKNAGVYRQYCPMAFNDKGAYWLSNETEIRNPYFGKKMLECGEVTDSL
ncbi:MAG TPA: DUF3347 domain-containing protein [Flavipsychrobacter sp.]|nr:DUF3347 domain-containing protein [Flavipsychrobacter sp.]